MRFATAYFATQPGTRVLTGTPRMCQRPIRALVEALRSLGADIAYAGEEGFPPLRIAGRRLQGGRAELPADISSQYISALLLVAPTLAGGLELRLRGGELVGGVRVSPPRVGNGGCRRKRQREKSGENGSS